MDLGAATISFDQALAKNNVVVTNQNCTVTYTFYNVKLGATITIYVVGGPAGPIQGRASKLDELPLVYEQLAHSLVTGAPMGTEQNVDRTNATNDQMAPRRVAADSLKFIRLGYGAVTGHQTTTGPSFGFGYRYELDTLAIEISAFNFIAASTTCGNPPCSSTGIGVTGDWIRLSGLKYQNPLGNDTTYFGAGIGWGANVTSDLNGTGTFAGSGLEGHAIGGYEMLRASTIRVFGEIDLTLPFYTSTNFSGGSRYIPSISAMFGFGFGHSNTVAVVNR